MFTKSISFDESKRIVVAVHDSFSSYLIKDESKKMLKEMAQKVLGSDFEKLEVSKSGFRVTVTEGTEESAKVKIEEEITKAVEMAMAFMSQMNSSQQQEQ